MESSIFTTKLSMLKKPSGEGSDADVRYLVDVETAGADGKIRVQRKGFGDV